MSGEVVVIGAGIGGLASAIRLQAAGFRVTVFEKNQVVGGKLAARSTPGGYVDLGPTLLTMVDVFEDLFRAGGSDLHRRLRLHSIDPTCQYRWSDGTTFNAWGDRQALLEETAGCFPEDVERLDRFLDDVALVYEATEDIFLRRPFRGLRELFSLRNVRLLPLLGKLGFTSTMHSSLSRRFRDERLVQLLGRFATYNGSSPYTAPATLNLIAHVELNMGSWYPEGGMVRLAEEIGSLATSIGVNVVTGVEVEGIRFDPQHRKPNGVVVDGEVVDADIVISNLDAYQTWSSLLVPAGLSMPGRFGRESRSCSGFLITAAAPVSVGRPDPGRTHHTIYFADDYRQEFSAVFDRGAYPDEMTIYRSIPAVSDASLAQDQMEGWYLLVNVPPGTTTSDPSGYTDRVLARLRSFGVDPGLVDVQTMGPGEIQSWYGSQGGAIYGASSNSLFSAFLRHGNRVRGIENLYFVGGSVHPGGGLPLVALSGKIVSDMIIAESE